jgi:hypothetical protein
MGNRSYVVFLSLPPFRFRLIIGIGAVIDDFSHIFTKFFSDALKCVAPTLILDGVVEKRGNRLVFCSTVFEDKARDSQQVRNVWDVCTFPFLVGV